MIICPWLAVRRALRRPARWFRIQAALDGRLVRCRARLRIVLTKGEAHDEPQEFYNTGGRSAGCNGGDRSRQDSVAPGGKSGSCLQITWSAAERIASDRGGLVDYGSGRR